MKTLIKVLLSLSLFTFSASNLYAADAKAGEKKSTMCASCHGENGVNKNASYPILAGQQAAYISAQLRAFKKETRDNPMMQHIAQQLSSDDINNLAAFFASLKNDSKHSSKTKVKKETPNKATMCQGCHGSKGEGRGTFPRLANQHIEYLEKQLKAFKSGDRKNSTMASMAKSLSDEDIKQLSIYFSGLDVKKK